MGVWGEISQKYELIAVRRIFCFEFQGRFTLRSKVERPWVSIRASPPILQNVVDFWLAKC